MKGISPIVAAVLLIAITMTVAAVLAYWSSSYIKGQLPEAGTEAQCKLASFDFYTCKYNSSSRIVIFTLNNQRNVELKNLTAFITYSNGSISTSIPLNDTLKGGNITGHSISNVPSDFSTIVVKTHCPEAEASSACTRS